MLSHQHRASKKTKTKQNNMPVHKPCQICIRLGRNFQTGCISLLKVGFLYKHFSIKKLSFFLILFYQEITIFYFCLVQRRRHVWMTSIKVIAKFWVVFSWFEKNKNVINIFSVKNWFQLIRSFLKPFDFIKWQENICCTRSKGWSHGHVILYVYKEHHWIWKKILD